MPHCRPMMKIRPQITSVEERIRLPAWRSPTPRKRKTLPLNTSATTRAQKPTISPNEAIQSRGSASHWRPIRLLPDVDDLGVGGEQRLREHVVEREDAERGDHHGLVDRAADALRAAGRGHALVTA